MITNERDDADLWYAIAAGVLVAVAAAIRFRVLGTTLFEDEVWVAELVRQGGWHAHSYSTPPLFYAICRGWSALRGVSNAALREPAAIFGVALCAVPFLAPLPRVSRFAWSVLLAFSSPLLFYSARLKQYTIEAFAVTVLIVLFLHTRRNDSRLATVAFFAAGAIAVMTLYSPVFVLVPMAILCVRRPHMLMGFGLLFALFGLAYVRWLAPGPESIRLHGDMNAYFAANGRWITSPASFIAGTTHWCGQAMNLVRFWWLAVLLLMVAWLFRERNIVIALLALVPPLSVAAASTIHLYPYGEVRLMIFCLPALYLLVADSIASITRRVPVLLLLLAPFVLNGVARDPYNETYMHVDDLRPMFVMIAHSHTSGEAIYADPSFAASLRYECPAVAADIRSGTERTVTRPGWYIQRIPPFDSSGAKTVLRMGDVIAARSAP
ncbi:MAG TPA: hypothetical protein VNN08_15355 [Thermoanaerobaculia bacterium]|nr:hypothetical protein [Thermoanaerobaculia bacterium]